MDAADLYALIICGSVGLAIAFIVCGFIFFGIDAFNAKKEKRKIKTGLKVWFIISIALAVLITIGFIGLFILAVLAMNSM